MAYSRYHYSFLLASLMSIFALSVTSPNCVKLDPLSDAFIDSINDANSTWIAGRNFAKDIDMAYIKRLTGASPSPKKLLDDFVHDLTDINIPEEFDSRLEWPHCPTIGEIRDQGACGSCWAFGAVEAMSDRVCIHSNGTVNFRFSADDVVACCRICGNGCNGGYPDAAWYYWLHKGLVSGGPYNSQIGCKPYEIAPCEHHMKGSRPSCNGNSTTTPVCSQYCETNYGIPYKEDLHFGATGYYIPQNVSQIQIEIMKNGPVEGLFNLFEDFLHYKSGVYQHVQGKLIDSHAIKIFGWGVEKGVPYWNIANSWNSDWGETGTFKFLRGRNHLYIESFITAGLPKY